MNAPAPIAIEPIQTRYYPQAGRLLVHGFRAKFQHLTNRGDNELALEFEHLLRYESGEASSRRLVALQDGEVLGTIGLKWKPGSGGTEKFTGGLFHKMGFTHFAGFGIWNTFKLLFGLYMLDYRPQAGECYVSDLAVHPDHRGQGIGMLLLKEACRVAEADPDTDCLSLYVSGNNPRARQLYERMSFRTQKRTTSFISHLLFDEREWDYMVMKLRSQPAEPTG